MAVSPACHIRSFRGTCQRERWRPCADRSRGSTAARSGKVTAPCSSTCIARAAAAAPAPSTGPRPGAPHAGSTESPIPQAKGCSEAGRRRFYLEPGVGVARLPAASRSTTTSAPAADCSTAVHILERAALRPGDSVLVQGAGAVGLSAIALARLGGAGLVSVIGAPSSRLNLARRMGADYVYDLEATTPADCRDAVHAHTHGEGFDVVIEAAGSARAVEEGLDLVRDGGRYVIAGHYTDVGPSTINAHRQINRKHLEIRGCWGSEPGHFLRALAMLERHAEKVPWRDVGERVYPLTGLNEALADAEAMRITKAVVDPWVTRGPEPRAPNVVNHEAHQNRRDGWSRLRSDGHPPRPARGGRRRFPAELLARIAGLPRDGVPQHPPGRRGHRPDRGGDAGFERSEDSHWSAGRGRGHAGSGSARANCRGPWRRHLGLHLHLVRTPGPLGESRRSTAARRRPHRAQGGRAPRRRAHHGGRQRWAARTAQGHQCPRRGPGRSGAHGEGRGGSSFRARARRRSRRDELRPDRR